jgi:exopolyphosphatase / guanosine-5'-triphosphate,3'-diphosphate pyrophosphatase
MNASNRGPLFAAIDVGTNAARLQIGRLQTRDAIETIHKERAPIRPGEGVFVSRLISAAAEARLLVALGRYAELSRRFEAPVRAVATSAFREADNAAEVTERLLGATGVTVEVISPGEEARLICLGALAGAAPSARSILFDVGGGSTEVVLARGCHPARVWSLPLGSVRFAAETDIDGLRARARRELAAVDVGPAAETIGTSGMARAVVGFASGGGPRATRDEVHASVTTLMELGAEGRLRLFQPSRADLMVAGAVIIDEILARLDSPAVSSSQAGLSDGILLELAREDLSSAA